MVWNTGRKNRKLCKKNVINEKKKRRKAEILDRLECEDSRGAENA